MSKELKETAAKQERCFSGEEQQKIDEVRSAVSPVPEKLLSFCSDASIARYLQAQNWNVKKATKVLNASLKWRFEYKPEDIRWEDIASEAESGKIYRSASIDKKSRPVLVMRPCRQNTNTVADQMKYLIYCMENAVLNMPPGQEQMIWLVDFWNFSLSNISLMAAKETALVLQNYYPERLGLAILYNPPWIFERFYTMVKPFLDSRTRDKVKFVYANDISTMKIMEDIFDMDQFEPVFGAKAAESFDVHMYAQRMKEDDGKKLYLCTKGNDASASTSCNDLINTSSLLENKDGDRDSSLTIATDSKDSPRVISLLAPAMSLEKSTDVKQHELH